MRRLVILGGTACLLAASLTACSQNTQQASETTTDSLLASSPVEQPAGDISPQTDYQAPPETPQETPAATTPVRPASKPRTTPSKPAPKPVETGTLVATGTPIEVAVNMQLSTETAKPGDTWTGEVKEAVIVGNDVVIPAGSLVEGVVNSVVPAGEKESRATLDLAVKSISVHGQSHPVTAGTEAIVAGSARARNLGAIAGGAAAGALIGKAVGGSGKGAVIGGLIGGAAATGAVAKSKGYQVVIKEGTVITFNVSKDVRIRA
jgi:hypothetical protein